MSLYTRKGDSGNTSLPDGKRVSKDDARVEAYGDVDELTSQISFLNALCSADGNIPASRRVSYYKPLLERIIRELFAVGGAIACPGSEMMFSEEIKALEESINKRILQIERKYQKIQSFFADLSSVVKGLFIILVVSVNILEKKISANGLDISKFDESVLYFFADKFSKNVRELEGAFNKACAYAEMMNKNLTIDIAKEVLQCKSEDTIDFDVLNEELKNKERKGKI